VSPEEPAIPPTDETGPLAPPPAAAFRWSVSRRQLVAVLLGVGVAALLIAGYLGYRSIERMRHRPPPIPRQTDVAAIQGWMTIAYVARAYRVPEPELSRAVGADPRQARTLSLNAIADQQGKGREAVLETVRQTVSSFQSAHPRPERSPPARSG